MSKLFSEYGEVETVRFRSISFSDPKLSRKIALKTGKLHEGRDTMNAYVVMKTESGAKEALQMNGTKLQDKTLRVDFASSKESRDPSRCVFVGNLPLDVMEEDLREFFTPIGEIDTVRIGKTIFPILLAIVSLLWMFS